MLINGITVNSFCGIRKIFHSKMLKQESTQGLYGNETSTELGVYPRSTVTRPIEAGVYSRHYGMHNLYQSTCRTSEMMITERNCYSVLLLYSQLAHCVSQSSTQDYDCRQMKQKRGMNEDEDVKDEGGGGWGAWGRRCDCLGLFRLNRKKVSPYIIISNSLIKPTSS